MKPSIASRVIEYLKTLPANEERNTRQIGAVLNIRASSISMSMTSHIANGTVNRRLAFADGSPIIFWSYTGDRGVADWNGYPLWMRSVSPVYLPLRADAVFARM